jgi:aryl-alcohol dehydrogenase-like predicted oxidoreductase
LEQREGLLFLGVFCFRVKFGADPGDRLLEFRQITRHRIPHERYGVPIGAAAIRFVLRHPAIVVGARDATEVIEDVSYLTAAVPAELFDELGAEHLMPSAVDRP